MTDAERTEREKLLIGFMEDCERNAIMNGECPMRFMVATEEIKRIIHERNLYMQIA